LNKVVKLKDGTEVTIRPLKMDDIDRSHAFFHALPEEDRSYLRRDVTKMEVVRQRINSMRADRVRRLVALYDGEIVADGSLELEAQGWKEHHAELRLIVSRKFQRNKLGMLMARELYLLAAQNGVEEIVVKMMETQIAARKIFERLGFLEDAVLRGYIKDLGGERHDLVVMRCSLKALWAKLEDYFADTDWQRTQ